MTTGFEGSPEIGGGRAADNSPERGPSFGGNGGGADLSGFDVERNPELGPHAETHRWAIEHGLFDHGIDNFLRETLLRVLPGGRVIEDVLDFFGLTDEARIANMAQHLRDWMVRGGILPPEDGSRGELPTEIIPANFTNVLTNAVQNAAAGRPLTNNQQAALGAAFLSTPSRGGAVHRDMVNQLAGSAGGEVRDNISAAVQQSLRAAIDAQRAARQDAEQQQRGTPARIAENAIGRLSEGKGLKANQQELFDGLTRAQQAALLDQALAPKGKPKIVQNIVARVESGKAPTKAQQRYLASLTPKQRETIAEPARKAERAAVRTVTRQRQQATKQQARVETLQERQQAAKQALRQKQQAQKAAAPDNTALAKRQAQQRRQQAARQEQQKRQQQQRQAAARKVQAAPKTSAKRKAAKQQQRGLLERQEQNRINVERRQTAARAVTLAKQKAEKAKAAQVAAKRRTQQARAVQAAAAPRNTGPLRNLPRAQQQAVLLTRAVSRRQAKVPLTARQRQTLKAAPRSARQPIARQAQASQAARAAQQAAAPRARQAAAKAAEAARRAAVQRQAQKTGTSKARRAAAAPRNMPTPLRNLSAAAQQQVLLTRAVARRQAGVKLTANQLRALKASTARQRGAVR